MHICVGILFYRYKEVHSRPYYQDFFRCVSAGTRESVLGQAEYDTRAGLKNDHVTNSSSSSNNSSSC